MQARHVAAPSVGSPTRGVQFAIEAESMYMDMEIGSLEPGKQAAVIVINMRRPG